MVRYMILCRVSPKISTLSACGDLLVIHTMRCKFYCHPWTARVGNTSVRKLGLYEVLSEVYIPIHTYWYLAIFHLEINYYNYKYAQCPLKHRSDEGKLFNYLVLDWKQSKVTPHSALLSQIWVSLKGKSNIICYCPLVIEGKTAHSQHMLFMPKCDCHQHGTPRVAPTWVKLHGMSFSPVKPLEENSDKKVL